MEIWSDLSQRHFIVFDPNGTVTHAEGFVSVTRVRLNVESPDFDRVLHHHSQVFAFLSEYRIVTKTTVNEAADLDLFHLALRRCSVRQPTTILSGDCLS